MSSAAGAGGSAPLVATLERGRQRIHRGCHLRAEVRAVAPASAVTLDALVADRARLADALARVGEDVGSPRPDVQASLFLEAYAWTLLLPLVGALVTERRVPILGGGAVAVRLRDGVWPDDLVLSDTRFAALDEDRDSGHPDAVVVAGEAALAAALHGQVVEHLCQPIGALTSYSRRPRSALWRSVADRLAAAALFAGETVGDVDGAARIARGVLSGGPPLIGGPQYRTIAGPSGPMRVHGRRGCCLWWRTRAASCCLTCPRAPRS